MHGWVTSRHEGCVSTMLTESGLSIPLRLRDFKALCDEKQGASRQARHFGVLSVLTPAGRPDRHVQGVGRRRVATPTVFTN